MNLWQVNDDGDPFDGQWAELIWAWGKDEAIEVAKRHYEYARELERSGKTAEGYFDVRLIDWPGIRQKPERDYPHAEHRCSVMRHAGWMEGVFDRHCESCGLYTMGGSTSKGVSEMLTDSERISIERIRTWGPDSVMLHNDAMKIANACERMLNELDPDPLNDPEYQAFAADQAGKCRCYPLYARPCGGLLAGGFCDELGEPEED